MQSRQTKPSLPTFKNTASLNSISQFHLTPWLAPTPEKVMKGKRNSLWLFQQSSNLGPRNHPWISSWCLGTITPHKPTVSITYFTATCIPWPNIALVFTSIQKRIGCSTRRPSTHITISNKCVELHTIPPIRNSSARSWNCPWMSPHMVTGHLTGCSHPSKHHRPTVSFFIDSAYLHSPN